MSDKPVPPIGERYPYTAPDPNASAGSSIQPRAVTRRADQVRAEISEAQQRLGKLQARQRELIRQFPDGDKANQHTAHVRENGRAITAVEAELQILEKRLSMAVDLDAEEGVSAGTDDFEGHLAAAMKHLQSRSKAAGKLEQGFELIREALQAYDAAGRAATEHLHEAGRHLPRRQRIDLAFNARRYISGAYGIRALINALSGAGVGRIGIVGGVILDTGGAQTSEETFESALAKCNNSIESQLAYWRTAAKGEVREPDREATADAKEAWANRNQAVGYAPRQIKWADETHFGAGGQRPGFTA